MADKAKRGSISTARRWRLMRRDGFRCRWCGVGADDAGVVLELDHILAHSLGGSDEDDNLATACERCNRGKSDSEIRPSEVDVLLLKIGTELADAGLPLGAVNRIAQAAQELGLPPLDIAAGWLARHKEERPHDPVGMDEIISDLRDMLIPRGA